MKSYASFLEGLYLNILRDIESVYPQCAAEWSRDHSRLLSNLESRGTRFFTVDLPAMGKHFDQCLASGRLVPSGLPCQRPFKSGVAVPRLFRALLRRVFYDDGALRPDVDASAVLFLRQLYYAAKKLRQECEPTYVYKTVAEFYDVEKSCRRPTLEWDSDHFVVNGVGARVRFGETDGGPDNEDSEAAQPTLFPKEESASTTSPCLPLLQRVCDWVVGGQFGLVNWRDLRPKHGPGAVADARVGVDNKYQFPHWPRKLENIFPIMEYGYANYQAWEDAQGATSPFAVSSDGGAGLESRDTVREAAVRHHLLGDVLGNGEVKATYSIPQKTSKRIDDAVSKRLDAVRCTSSMAHEPPSRLIAVPKTQKGPRLIASEPVSHQWMQQALKRELERMVKQSVLGNSIVFDDQEPSRKAALEASRTGLRATIDLSSASDRLSCWTVERVFRSHGDLLQAFHAVRTRWLINTIDKKQPKYVILRKFAPMGSALTFPVQSIVYALVAITAVLHCRQWKLDKTSISSAARQVRVYGDDIIVPVDVAGVLTELLAELGLKVNLSKTFTTGNFRESCGMDAYAGVDVTPAYVLEVCDKTRPESVVSSVESSNNFFKKGFWHTANYIQSTVPSEIRKRIPTVSSGSGAFGFTSFVGDRYSGLKGRWNRTLQRPEVKCLSIRSRISKHSAGGWPSLLQYFTEEPDPMQAWESGVGSRPKVSLNLRWVSATT